MDEVASTTNVGTSPVPRTSPTVVEVKKITMTFAQALDALVDGKKVRRLDWEDEGFYLELFKEELIVYRPDDKQRHPLIVSLGDITREDWVIKT